MPITYNANIPNPPDRPSASQPQILANFQGINAIMDINHYTFASTDAGKHKFIQLPIVIAAPTTAPNELALYTKLEPLTNANQMYIRIPDNGAEIPFTARGTDYTWLPSGLLMKWGTTQLQPAPITTNTQTINYPVAADIPVFANTAFSIMITDSTVGTGDGIDPNWHVYIGSLGTATGFDIRVYQRTNSANATLPVRFNWLAIGRGF